jgi:FkbM family methyltransferase
MFLERIVIFLLGPTFGRKKFQIFYKKMFSLALRGMNYGRVGSGEKEVLRLVGKIFKKNDKVIIFDVGANVGEYSLQIAEEVGEKAKIFAFEPSQETFQFLKHKTSSFNVNCFNLALGSNDEIKSFYYDSESSTLASFFDHNESLKSKKLEILVKKLDSFCDENGISHINFLKIDVEGFEYEVLNGAQKMLEQNKIDLIQFEFGATQIAAKTFLKDFYNLLNPQFKIYRLLADGLEPLVYTPNFIEVFSYSNFLCISKNLKWEN